MLKVINIEWDTDNDHNLQKRFAKRNRYSGEY